MTSDRGEGADWPELPDETARRLAAAVSEAFEAEVDCLARLVAVPTVHPPGDLGEAAERIAGILSGLGFEVETLPVPQPFVRQHGRASLSNLIARPLRPRACDGPVVALMAAADTAPAGEGWSVDPFAGVVADGRLFGRGAASSKGDLACFLFAAKALAAACPHLEGSVELHVTFDDETGGFLGPQYLLAQDIVRPDFAIAAGETHGVCTRQAGCLQLDVVLRGRQAHAASAAGGRDALEAATRVLSALYAERERLAGLAPPAGASGPSLTVANIAGGLAANLVPDRVVLRLDRRLVAEEDGESVEAAIAGLVDGAVAGMEGIEAEVQRRLCVPPTGDMSGGSGLAALVRREAGAVLSEDVPQFASAVISGARFYAAAGIPTVGYGVGPAGSGARGEPYGPDESVPLADLEAATVAVARTLAVLVKAG